MPTRPDVRVTVIAPVHEAHRQEDTPDVWDAFIDLRVGSTRTRARLGAAGRAVPEIERPTIVGEDGDDVAFLTEYGLLSLDVRTRRMHVDPVMPTDTMSRRLAPTARPSRSGGSALRRLVERVLRGGRSTTEGARA